MRNKITAGNWKMNLTPQEGVTLINDVLHLNPALNNNKIIFCVPFTHLALAQQAIANTNNKNIVLGAQNCYYQNSGAYTGEISLPMLKTLGVQAIIVGHSERRQYFNEDNELLKHKIDAILAADLTPIFCCGEPLAVREANTQNDFVAQQLKESILHLEGQALSKIIIAYEPIWAIGTGKTATTAQAQEMHAHIRSLLNNNYGTIAQDIAILYGGSCNPTNAAELFSQPDVDGGLIGGASLKADQFTAIANAMN